MKEYANIVYNKHQFSSNKYLKNSVFKGCHFEKCDLSEYTFTNCEFISCEFIKCKFAHAFIGHNRGLKSGKYLNCTFKNSDFTNVNFRFPVIENCIFENCDLFETNFDGSRFKNTRFIGLLDSCFFRGHSIYARGFKFFLVKKIDFKVVPNLMQHVDFVEAKLVGVTFSDGIDLSTCVFPSGENYVFVRDLKNTMQNAAEIVSKEWKEERKKNIALSMINEFYYRDEFRGQKSNFYDAFIPKEGDDREGNEDGMDLFRLIKSLA